MFMTSKSEQQRAAEKILDDESLISKLKDDEAKALIDWALAEIEAGTDESGDALNTRLQRTRTAMREINELVGDKQNLVADDLEERLVNLLVGDLDPKSSVRLSLSREIAQVTAEKDHLDNVELVRRFTQLSTKAWIAKAQSAMALNSNLASTQAETAATAPTMQTSAAPRSRPIPRPTKVEEKKPSFFQRLLGKK
jgi:hypothetical protein